MVKLENLLWTLEVAPHGTQMTCLMTAEGAQSENMSEGEQVSLPCVLITAQCLWDRAERR